VAVAAERPLGFPPERRMRRKADFDAVYGRGRRIASDGLFTMNALRNDALGPRLGLAVAARVAGKAVERNRVRRIIRESFRLTQQSLPSFDIVVGTRAAVRSATNAQLRDSLLKLWPRLIKVCASLPSS
jgi:ribonuclease P protein component